MCWKTAYGRKLKLKSCAETEKVKERIHMSKNQLVLEKRSHVQMPGMKPCGFWYGIGPAWREWVQSEMPHWIGEFNYELSLGKSAILVIDTCASKIAFKIVFKCSQYVSKTKTKQNLIFKNGPTPASFYLFLVFTNKQ